MWTIDKLQSYFERKGIPAHYYSFYEEKDDSFCLSKENSFWLVYYSERGKRKELGLGKNESQGLNILRLFALEEFNES